jgi:hypothetical protein
LETLFRDVTIVARLTQQWQHGVGFRDSAAQRERIALFARKGALRAMVLYLEDQPISFWICTQYGRGLYLDFTGYAPAFRRYEPGTVALFRIIEQACREGVGFIDMGSGQYEYMRKYSNQQFLEGTVLVFSASARGILLNTLRLLTLGPIELVRSCARLCGVEARLKQLFSRGPGIAVRSDSGWRLAFFVLLSAVVYLSWKPSPGIAEVRWLPSVLGTWFDENDGWKNFIGFGLLAMALLMAWRRPKTSLRPDTFLARDPRERELKLFLGFCCFVELMELGQLALPMRTCDWKDVLAGWAGGLLAWASLYVPRGLRSLAT